SGRWRADAHSLTSVEVVPKTRRRGPGQTSGPRHELIDRGERQPLGRLLTSTPQLLSTPNVAAASLGSIWRMFSSRQLACSSVIVRPSESWSCCCSCATSGLVLAAAVVVGPPGVVDGAPATVVDGAP